MVMVRQACVVERPLQAPPEKDAEPRVQTVRPDVPVSIFFRIRSAEPASMCRDVPTQWILRARYTTVESGTAVGDGAAERGVVESAVVLPQALKTMVAVARVDVHQPGKDAYAGEMLPLHVSLVVFHALESPEQTLMLSVVADERDWLLAGARVTQVTVRSGEPLTVVLRALALHDGWLPLPVVRLVTLVGGESVGDAVPVATPTAGVRFPVLPRASAATFVPLGAAP
eukprot:Unigene12415_Nuclearia_a/m.37726 Unigene12415_Nuclearia_a/g.37726  ORF Unigene12415_Nuclearia_a/g.37726 Unigene12415_Nuclearia_a/m.37726 type:complete len:228 (+) Unigene12415_Nuclearia_a:2947-3630(+)